jgi:hypothetical protein
MKPCARWLRAGAAIAFGGWLAGCGWEEIDALIPPAGGGFDAGSGTPDAAGLDTTEPPDATPAEGVAPDNGSDAAVATGDVDASSLPCNSSVTPVRAWTFDSDTEGWVFLLNSGVSGGVSWTGSTGDPSPGALEVDVTSLPADAGTLNGGWVEFQATALGNLTGRVVSAWVWLDSGTTPNVKVFVQTGSQYTWADNGTVHLMPHVWTCLSLDVSSPSYTNGPDYDPQNVVRLGFEMLGPTPFRVYVDSVSYE